MTRRHRGDRERCRRRTTRQRGSAYLLVMMALVVLSIMGLGISLVSQTELRIGANERTVQRVFYAADSGLSISAARALAKGDFGATEIALSDPGTPGALGFHHDVEVSPFVPIFDAPCNLCEINQEGHYGSESYRRINHVVGSLASRVGGVEERVTAEKLLTLMVEVQPMAPSTEAMLPLGDPEAMKKVRF